MSVLDERLARGVLADLDELLETDGVLQDRVQRSQRDLRQDRDGMLTGGRWRQVTAMAVGNKLEP